MIDLGWSQKVLEVGLTSKILFSGSTESLFWGQLFSATVRLNCYAKGFDQKHTLHQMQKIIKEANYLIPVLMR